MLLRGLTAHCLEQVDSTKLNGSLDTSRINKWLKKSAKILPKPLEIWWIEREIVERSSKAVLMDYGLFDRPRKINSVRNKSAEL